MTEKSVREIVTSYITEECDSDNVIRLEVLSYTPINRVNLFTVMYNSALNASVSLKLNAASRMWNVLKLAIENSPELADKDIVKNAVEKSTSGNTPYFITTPSYQFLTAIGETRPDLAQLALKIIDTNKDAPVHLAQKTENAINDGLLAASVKSDLEAAIPQRFHGVFF